MSKVYKDMLEESMRKSDKNIDITPDEADKLKNAFDDPKFRDMFNDYLQEISDPKYRDETELYIQQLEQEGHMPDGKELIRPNPGFVVKVLDESNNKIFINICHSDKVEKMELKYDEEKKGYMSHIPLLVSPARMETDKTGKPCITLDVCFHPDTVFNCTNNQKLLEIVVKCSIENAEVRLKQGNPDTKLKSDFHVLKGISCKGEKPSIFIVPKNRSNGQSRQEIVHQKSQKNETINKKNNTSIKSPMNLSKLNPSSPIQHQNQQKSLPPLKTNQIDTKTVDNNKIQNINSKLNITTNTTDSNGISEDQIVARETTTITSTRKEKEPRCELIYSDSLELLNYHSDPRLNIENVPKYLVIKLHVPLLKSMKEAILDVNQDSIQFSVHGIYYLDLPLPYKINEEEGNAKYDKIKQLISITLPVKRRLYQTNQVKIHNEFNKNESPNENDTINNDEEGSADNGTENIQTDFSKISGDTNHILNEQDHSYFINREKTVMSQTTRPLDVQTPAIHKHINNNHNNNNPKQIDIATSNPSDSSQNQSLTGDLLKDSLTVIPPPPIDNISSNSLSCVIPQGSMACSNTDPVSQYDGDKLLDKVSNCSDDINKLSDGTNFIHNSIDNTSNNINNLNNGENNLVNSDRDNFPLNDNLDSKTNDSNLNKSKEINVSHPVNSSDPQNLCIPVESKDIESTQEQNSISLIIPTRNIVKESVHIDIENNKMTFSYNDLNNVHYTGSCTFYGFIKSEFQFDTSDANMIIICNKVVPKLWKHVLKPTNTNTPPYSSSVNIPNINMKDDIYKIE